jgi:hypothetical protein
MLLQNILNLWSQNWSLPKAIGSTYRNRNWASLTVGSRITTRTAPKTKKKKTETRIGIKSQFWEKRRTKIELKLVLENFRNWICGFLKSKELPTLVHTSAPSIGNSKKGKDRNPSTKVQGPKKTQEHRS